MTCVDTVLQQLPSAFLSRLRALLPSESLQCVLASFTQSREPGFRVNTLKVEPEAVLAELMASGVTELQPVTWRQDTFVAHPSQRHLLVNSAASAEGRIYIQNPASIFAAQLLQAQPGEQVLDLAAAPGGKTLVLAADMANSGRIAAVEAVRDRFYRLKENLVRCGAKNVECFLKDGRRVGRQCPEMFDRVLLDAPCSSEARISVDDTDSYRFWSEKKISDMQRKQKQLLFSALQALKPGGRLVYSTCSYAPEENELVVARQLQIWGDGLEILPVDVPFANAMGGVREWRGKSLPSSLVRSVRVLPDGVMEGFFVCLLQKKAGVRRLASLEVQDA